MIDFIFLPCILNFTTRFIYSVLYRAEGGEWGLENNHFNEFAGEQICNRKSVQSSGADLLK